MRKHGPRIVGGVVAFLALGLAILIGTGTLFSPDLSAAGPQQNGNGVDPLTSHEKSLAHGAVLTGAWRTRAAGSRPELQYLYAQRHEVDKSEDALSAPRRADVYLYDYKKNRAVRRLVNLATGKVERTEFFDGQPPIAAAEASRAGTLVMANPKLGKGLRAAYRKVTGKDLTSIAQVRTQALRFDASQAVAASNRATVAKCGTNRCAQLFIRLPNSQWVDTSRLVIDLTTRTVHILQP